MKLRKRLGDYGYLFIIGGLIVALDQWTKALVRANLNFQEQWAPWEWLEPYARIVHWRNTGAAFGMLPNMSTVFTILAIVVAGAIIYYFPRVPREDWFLRLAMGMQLGGAIGNLIDRLTQNGVVTDFISVMNFAVFNVADASISVGVAILVVGLWMKEKQEARNSSQASDTDTQMTEPGDGLLPEENCSD